MSTSVLFLKDPKPRLIQLFNEWLRRYIADPSEFNREFQQVQTFTEQAGNGEVPSYGKDCVAYLEKLDAEIPE